MLANFQIKSPIIMGGGWGGGGQKPCIYSQNNFKMKRDEKNKKFTEKKDEKAIK